MEHKLIIKSKFIVPQLPEGVLITNRIRELGIEKYRVVSVVAPAGYGKTTAILASLCRRENLHWYRMDKEDSRLPIFYAHFLKPYSEESESRSRNRYNISAVYLTFRKLMTF